MIAGAARGHSSYTYVTREAMVAHIRAGLQFPEVVFGAAMQKVS